MVRTGAASTRILRGETLSRQGRHLDALPDFDTVTEQLRDGDNRSGLVRALNSHGAARWVRSGEGSRPAAATRSR